MNRMVTRADLITILNGWQQGHLSAAEVHAWAEARYLPGDFDVDDEEDSGSAAVEVLSRLDMLHINLMTPEDIPHYLELLRAPTGAFAEALKRFEAQNATIDFRAREHALSTTEPYASIKVQPDLADVSWLLDDLCSKFGYSLAVREPERFMRLVPNGPDSFADAVLVAEGLDPALETRLRSGVREFVAARFELWASRRGAV